MEDIQVEIHTSENTVTTIAVISNAQLFLSHTIHKKNHIIIGLTEPIVLPAGEYGSILSHGMIASDTIILLHRSARGMFVSSISDQDVILWSHAVSSDAQYLTIAPDTKQQIFVVAANSITIVQDQGVSHVLPVNGFCEVPANHNNNTTSTGMVRHPDHDDGSIKLSIALDGSRWVWLSETAALVILRRGSVFLYTASRLLDTGKSIPSCEVSTAILLMDRLLFIGSRLSDALLLNVEWQVSPIPARWRQSQSTTANSMMEYEFSAEERELYHVVSDTEEDSSSLTTEQVPVLKAMTVQDRLLSLSPISTSSTASVCAIGYGVSGGLGYLHTAGTHGILAQHDMAHVLYLGCIYGDRLVLGFKDRGVRCLDESGSEIPLQNELLAHAHVLLAGGDGILVLRDEMTYTVVSIDRTGAIQQQWEMTNLTSNVVSVTNFLPSGLFGYLEENGTVALIDVAEWSGAKTPAIVCLPDLPADMAIEGQTDDEANDEEEDMDLKLFYADPKITAIDLFLAPKSLFAADLESSMPTDTEDVDMEVQDYDAEEKMLYAEETRKVHKKEPNFIAAESGSSDDTVYCAVCRQNGSIEVYEYLGVDNIVLRFQAQGVGFGLDRLSEDRSSRRLPRSQKIYVQELCFFRSDCSDEKGIALPPKYFMTIETSAGDIYLYRIDQKTSMLVKQPLGIASRQSKEQGRHRAKLVRKGAVARGIEEDPFKYKKFYPFSGISQQTGLFVSTFRPFWLLSDRGSIAVVDHRSLHAAPAGGQRRPIAGFAALTDGTFAVVHERVGRVGTQRLTLFGSILKPQCIFTGNLAVEKYPLGVTVRKIVALPEEESSDRPLYALLISRETWVDQSDLNSDGLTDEERDEMKAQKEAIRMKKQVEADLGGFDMENEWVEEIDREDFIQINTEFGGAPPIHQPAYSLWIVDASNAFRVVDSYQLEEYEHGIDLKVMSLTDFTDADNNDDTGSIEEENKSEVPFVVVGTGIVTRDGEDVAAKGRALLFRVQRTKAAHVAELSLVYEKTIFHGPVTTISCLSAEGNSRLVIGAGADVNVEQWGDERLTQVGFYRATMHILKIQHFKSFLVLSDAYDSVYFLVWRESDKSLTLLAKDYDPIAIYAAGVLARGAALSLCVHDERENLQFFQYAPAEAAARGGNKLVCRADFHLGETTVNLSSTHYCRSPLFVHSATPVSTQAALKQQDPLFGRQDDDHRVAIHFGTADGSFGSIVAVSEPVFWRLMALQSVMANALEFDAGLNPRLWRLYRRSNRGCRNNDRKKGVIDGNLVTRFVNLSIPEQEDLASSIGTTVDLIMDNCVDIQCANKAI